MPKINNSRLFHAPMAKAIALILCFSVQLFAFDLTIDRSQTAIGVDGTNDTLTNTYQFNFENNILLMNQIEIDFSAFGTGEGFGIDLYNVDDDDLSLNGTLLGILTIFNVQTDNVNKILSFSVLQSISLNETLELTVHDIQNPPCPGIGEIKVNIKNALNITDQGRFEVHYDQATLDADNDGLPDGYEIYYSNGSSRGDTDGNPMYKNANFNPDVFNLGSFDTDNDGFSDMHEFFACSHPWNHTSTPSTLDQDNDHIYDFDEISSGLIVDSDGDSVPDYMDIDSDGDGISDQVEAGDLDPNTFPVDSDLDGIPDFQDTDSDNDSIPDIRDNCRTIANQDQSDITGNGKGDVCDTQGISAASAGCGQQNASSSSTLLILLCFLLMLKKRRIKNIFLSA